MRAAGKGFEQIELGRGKVPRSMRGRLKFTASKVQHPVPEYQPVRQACQRFGGGRTGTAQNCADARNYFARVERLGNIVIGADFEATGAVTIGSVGDADARLMRHQAMVGFATAWLDRELPTSSDNH